MHDSLDELLDIRDLDDGLCMANRLNKPVLD